MERGRDFLRSQVNNAIMQHQALVENIEDHIDQADDLVYRQLCERYLPRLKSHQMMLEEYGKTIGADGPSALKGVLGAALGKARDVVDAVRESDFLRVVGDIVTIRQSQDTFATFAAVGERIGDSRLAEIGKQCERDHDAMQRDFNELVRNMFVAHVQGSDRTDQLNTTTDARM